MTLTPSGLTHYRGGFSPGEIAATSIGSAKAVQICIAGDVTVAAEDRGAIVAFRKNDNIGLVIAGARQKICVSLCRIIGSAEISVSIGGVELEPAVVEASHHFDDINNRPLEDPRLRRVSV